MAASRRYRATPCFRIVQSVRLKRVSYAVERPNHGVNAIERIVFPIAYLQRARPRISAPPRSKEVTLQAACRTVGRRAAALQLHSLFRAQARTSGAVGPRRPH